MVRQGPLVLTADLKANLRFAENFSRHKIYLLEIDRKRFIGLGEENTQIFVRHATGLADHLNFRYIEEAQYIMFIMTYLGSYFYEDPRYVALARTLAKDRAPTSDRIQELHKGFCEFSNTFLSDDLSVYRHALGSFFEALTKINQRDLRVEKIYDMFFDAYGSSGLKREHFPIEAMNQHAHESAQFLSIKTQSGTAISLALGLWMGSRFHKDPLYPWCRDCLENLPADSHQREMSLREYATKRLKRQLAAIKPT